MLFAAITYLGLGVALLALLAAAGVAFARSDTRSAVVRSIVCVVSHSPAWYRTARVPTGFADWTDVVCCPHCGDRWCRSV